MTVNQKWDVIDAIAYSRLVSRTFTIGECIVLHQWHNGHTTPSVELMNKYKAVRDAINEQKWTKPNIKIVEGGDLFQECPDNLTWSKVINN